ncbi:MAG: hypothetical protein IJ461_00240 [Clostridia bacterium]|nr:hypothetical protein [Clostridia bacterium]
MEPEKALESLQQLPGIGPWTAHYIAMGALGWTDALSHTDLEIKRQMAGCSSREILAAAEKWRPWRAYAVMCLWQREEREGNYVLPNHV